MEGIVMPYIKQEDRPEMDKIVDSMIKAGVKVNGDLNYIIFKFCKDTIGPLTNEEGYNKYKNFRGELSEVRDEIGRRFLAPYEEEKKKTNGDVGEFDGFFKEKIDKETVEQILDWRPRNE
jgi:hypothetical protein